MRKGIERVLSHSKGSQIRVISEPPLPLSGKDGDIRMMPSYQDGAVLYIKVAGKWFSFKPEKDVSEPASIEESGYITLGGGLIVQWGSLTHGSTSVTLTFPVPFPNAAFMCVVSAADAGISPTAEQCGTDDLTKSQVTVIGYRADSGASVGTVHWIAIGN
tara:strand:- start:127 stop:606 length:480 start_codon:yes stop_codon:yes gene_type:complete